MVQTLFDGDENNFELWETRFLTHTELCGLRAVISEDPEIDEDDEAALAEDEAKNRGICRASAMSRQQEFFIGNEGRET